jgi:predicted metalloprotease with PDZ domain
MREMYRLYGPSGITSQGYPPGAFEALIEKRVGKSVGLQIKSLLTTVTDPDVDAALDYYGLELDRNPGKKAAVLAGGAVPADFGLIWSVGENLVTVESVVLGGAGAEAGVLPGDELLAISGQRVSPTNFQDRILRLKPEESAVLLLARHNRIIELPIRVQDAIPDKYRIIVKANIKNREKQRMSNWLGMELAFIKN